MQCCLRAAIHTLCTAKLRPVALVPKNTHTCVTPRRPHLRDDACAEAHVVALNEGGSIALTVHHHPLRCQHMKRTKATQRGSTR